MGSRVVQRFATRRAGLEYVCGNGGRLVARALPSSGHGGNATPANGAGAALRMTEIVTGYFLPKGYPESVGSDYLAYSAWTGASTAIGAAGGVLSMQALLCAVGIGGSAAAPLAASLNWVIKDGLGQVAAVLSAAIISDRFDADPKRWRAVAAGCEVGARCIESAAPLAPGQFLLLASAANLGKSVACLAASATRASFHKSLTRRQNLADITGKAGSQAIASSLAGTALGLGLSTTLVASPADALPLVFALSIAQLGATHASLRVLALPILTRSAADELIAAQLDNRSMPTPADFSNATQHWLPLPFRHVARRLTQSTATDGPRAPPVTTVDALPRIVLGSCSLDELCHSEDHLVHLRHAMKGTNHLIAVPSGEGASHRRPDSRLKDKGAGGSSNGSSKYLAHAWPPNAEIRVLVLDGASPNDILLALLHATIIQRQIARSSGKFVSPPSVDQCPHSRVGGSTGDGLGSMDESWMDEVTVVAETLQRALREYEPFISSLCAAGWDLETANYVEDEVSRLAFSDPV